MEEKAVQTVVEDKLPSDDALRTAWKDLCELYKSRPRLAQTLVSAKLAFEENPDHKLLTFQVLNESQKTWIEQNLLRDIEKNLCNIVGNGKIRLAVDVVPVASVETKAYMPAEQAIDLINSNPEVKDLVKDFGLDAK